MMNVLDGDIAQQIHVDGTPGTYTKIHDGDIQPYTGVYEVTPDTTEQVLETNGRRMLGNVIINPIPSNYGLITWNGATLTVS